MATEHDEFDEDDRWYRSKIAARVPRHRRKTRATAFVVLGAFKIAGTGVRVTGSGVKRYRRRRGSRRIPGRGAHCGACGVSYRTIAMLNEHYRTAHDAEPTRPAARPPVKRPPNERRAVRPANRGSVVAGTTRPPDPRTEAAVAKYREHLTKLGEQAMNDNPVALLLRRAAEELDGQNPRGRMEMYGHLSGMEAAFAVFAEAIDAYALRLKREHPHGESVRGRLSPELVNPHFRRMREGAEELQRGAAAFIAAFEEINALAIRASRGDLDNGGPKFLGK